MWRFRLVRVVLVLACCGCATHAGVSTSDVESVATGNRVTLLVLGTGNKWATRTEPDLYMLVEARNPAPTEKVQIDLPWDLAGKIAGQPLFRMWDTAQSGERR